jgi:hypothetical protein
VARHIEPGRFRERRSIGVGAPRRHHVTAPHISTEPAPPTSLRRAACHPVPTAR